MLQAVQVLEDQGREALARMAKMVAAAGTLERMQILYMVRQAPRGHQELMDALEMSQSTLSRNIGELERGGWIVQRRMPDGTKKICVAEYAVKIFTDVSESVMHHPESPVRSVADVARAMKEIKVVSPDELRDRLDRGDHWQDPDDSPLVLDVRPAAEYAAGHLIEARSFPVTEIETMSAQQVRDRVLAIDPRLANPELPILIYCRGPFCVFSFEASERLAEAGFPVCELIEQGVPEMGAAGLPIDRPSPDDCPGD